MAQSQRYICQHGNKERNVWMLLCWNLSQTIDEKEIILIRILQKTAYARFMEAPFMTDTLQSGCQ